MFTDTLAPSSQTDATPIFDKHHTFINSSAVKEAWYSTSERSLVIAPVDGDRYYQYLNVPQAEWEAFIQAWSAGQYWQTIRNTYGPTTPLYDRPEQVTLPSGSQQATKYTVTVQVSGSFEVSVESPSLAEALAEVEDDLNDKLRAVGIAYDIVGVTKA